MRLYHCTYSSKVPGIIQFGFQDNHEGGVWVADRPINEMGLHSGDIAIVIQIPKTLIEIYDRTTQDDWRYDRFLIPSEILNSFKPFSLIDQRFSWVEQRLMKMGGYEHWVAAGKP